MCEIYSEVSAILSSHIICAMEGCVTEAIRNCVHTTGVKVLSENNMQYLLSGTLEGIIAAGKELQNLLKTLKSAENCRKCNDITNDIHYLTSTSTNCENEFSGISETDNNENVSLNGCMKNGVSSNSRKASVKKLRFVLRERPRLKWSKLMRRCVTPKKKNRLLKRDESDVLSMNLEQMKLSTENSSDCDSKLNTDSSREENSPKKCREGYEDSSPYKYFCDLCSFKTKRSSHYAKHVAIHKKVSTLYHCSQCSFTSIRLSHLRRHEISHSSTLHSCSQCHYKTDDAKFLLRHVRLKHNGHRDKFAIILNCPYCSYHTTKQHYFERHKRMHCTKERNVLHQCDKCPYKTHRKEHYVRHINNVHSNKRPYLCHLCGKAFKRGDALQQHNQTHSDVKETDGTTFKCCTCEKSFRSQSHLSEHKAVHSKVRSFLCEICGASFKTRSVQRKHVTTIHRNPRAYSCNACPKRFNTLYVLKRHQKVHINGKSSADQESDAETDDVTKSFLDDAISEFKQVNIESIAQDLNATSSMADLDQQLPPLINEQFSTEEMTIVQPLNQEIMPETAVSNAEIIQQITPAFFQPQENATALIYLTNGIVPF